ncbi:MAG: response regulator [Candidatus Thiodiazotropha sp. (ex Monitilora ramsayi)]|nr:response regulator [Candidatus Thiodiazotropha sp. (ex Monitilora ramsayi)]
MEISSSLVSVAVFSSVLLLFSQMLTGPFELWEMLLSVSAATLALVLIRFRLKSGSSNSQSETSEDVQSLLQQNRLPEEQVKAPYRQPGSMWDTSSEHAPTANEDVLIISRDPRHIDPITDCLRTWGKRYATTDNSIQALCRLMNHGSSHTLPDILIVDTQRLDIAPAHLPCLLKNEPRLASIKLLFLGNPQSRDDSHKLLKAGYTGLIETPVNKSQLFSIIEGHGAQSNDSDNIVYLTRYRKSRKQRHSQKTILLAEQNTTERSQLEKVLRGTGYRVKSVENGEQALEALEQQPFDMAVINLQLPIMNGTQVIKLHRFTTPHQHWVPFIIITNQNTPATLRLCRELQIRACLFKPVPAEELLNMIKAAPECLPPLTVPANRQSPTITHYRETQFHHTDLLDRRVLSALEQLDDDRGFVSGLIEVFVRDCAVILQGMQESVELDQPERFFNLCGILMDNSGQLGAFALYEMCINLERVNKAQFRSEIVQKLPRLSQLASLTSQAFHAYLSEQHTYQHDRS